MKTEPARKADSQYSYTFTGWDDMETGRKENLTGADTVQSPVTENKNYIAVYRNIPREYTVILEDAYEMCIRDRKLPIRNFKYRKEWRKSICVKQ